MRRKQIPLGQEGKMKKNYQSVLIFYEVELSLQLHLQQKLNYFLYINYVFIELSFSIFKSSLLSSTINYQKKRGRCCLLKVSYKLTVDKDLSSVQRDAVNFWLAFWSWLEEKCGKWSFTMVSYETSMKRYERCWAVVLNFLIFVSLLILFFNILKNLIGKIKWNVISLNILLDEKL